MKRKVLVLASSYPNRVSDSNGFFIHDLAKSYSKEFDVYVLTPKHANSLKHEVMEGVKVYRFSYWFGDKLFSDGEIMSNLKLHKSYYWQVIPFFVCQFIAVYKLIAKHQISIVHANWIIPSGIVAVLFKKLINGKVKIIVSLLGADIWSFNSGIRKRLLQFIFNNVNYVTTQSNPLRDEAIKIGYKGQIETLPLSIDTNLYKPNLKERKYNPQYPRMLFVATLSERKGIMLLIRSLKEVKNTNPEFFIDIVGDGPLRRQAEEEIELLGLVQNVTIHGFQPPEQLPEFFNNTDIFILPSLSEGFPLVVLSSLSCGVCTIVSDLPVFRELNALDTSLLILFETDNQTSLSSSINNTIKNLEGINKNKQNRRNFIVNNYDKNDIAKRYSAIVNNL